MAQALTLQLTQAEAVIAGKVEISNVPKQDVLNKIGEASGYLANLQTLIQSTSEQKRDTVKRLEINQYLKDAIHQKSASWSSAQGSTSKIQREFVDKFQSDLSDLIGEWTQTTIIHETLTPTLKAIDSNSQSKIYQFQKSAEAIDQGTGSQLSTQLTVSLNQVAPQLKFNTAADSKNWDAAWDIGIGGIGGFGGDRLLAGGVALVVSSVAFFLIVLTGGAIVRIAAAGVALQPFSLASATRPPINTPTHRPSTYSCGLPI